jgi:hypothetical protein
MPDIYSTDALVGVLQDLKTPKSALLDRYFGTVQTEESEEIHFDKASTVRKLAPFVSPVVEGQVMQERGYTTETFKPAYVKPKTPIDPNRPLKRAMGERIGGGQLSNADRELLAVRMTLEEHVQFIRNRQEWMAAQAMLTGAVTISGDKYASVSISFNRDAGHTVTLTGNDRWSIDHVDSVPSDDLQDWATLIAKNGGGDAIDVVMEPTAWKAFRSNPRMTNKLDFKDARGNEINLGAMRERGLSFKGTTDGFNIFVYQDWYETDAGVVTPFLAAGSVLMASPDVEGVQAFGAIRDPEAGYQAMPFFPKSWIENDPAQRFVMTQSAPLVVPFRSNATLAATVL